MSSYTILVVEDNDGLRDVLARALREEDYSVVTAVDGAQAIRAADARRPDVIVLDVGLPDSDGRDVCQALRARGCEAPVIFLTARNTVADRLSGFAAGGDDYLSKPFAIPELFARLRALLKRAGTPSLGVTVDFEVDPRTHSLLRDDVRIPLSPTEYRLIGRLAAAGVVRRRQLVEAAWPAGAIVSDNTLDQYIRKLRRKLDELGTEHTIRTARGVGYELV